MSHEVKWLDRGRPPRQPPNPSYPQGCHVDLTKQGLWRDQAKLQHPPEPNTDEKNCTVPLPYPTGHENIGTWWIRCSECGLTAMITAASRTDDPRSVRLACKVGQ